MQGYVVQVTHDVLGSAAPKLETLYVLSENGAAAVTLVRTALRLETENAAVVGSLTEEEVRSLGLKPFQVRHAPAETIPSIDATIAEALKRGDDKP